MSGSGRASSGTDSTAKASARELRAGERLGTGRRPARATSAHHTKVAYLVLAHDAPAHFGRLVEALTSDSSAVFVHIDAKADLARFTRVAGPDVHLTGERVRVEWGDFSQVEAILGVLRDGLADPRRFDRFALISGADYPLRSPAYIERFFERHRGTEFINLVAMPCDEVGKPIRRLTTYQPRPGRGATRRAIRRLVMRLGPMVHRRDYRAGLGGLAPYGGSTWWALTRGAAEHVLDFVEREPDVTKFFEHVVCPDESFVQTIVANSPFGSRVRRNLTFADWSDGGASPAHLTAAHLPVIGAPGGVAADDAYGRGELLFARKFGDADADIVAELDQMIADRESDIGPPDR